MAAPPDEGYHTNITQEKAEVLMVVGPCFKSRKPGHLASDCVQQREPPTCYRCNKVGHIATKCRTRDVYCTICMQKFETHDGSVSYQKKSDNGGNSWFCSKD